LVAIASLLSFVVTADNRLAGFCSHIERLARLNLLHKVQLDVTASA